MVSTILYVHTSGQRSKVTGCDKQFSMKTSTPVIEPQAQWAGYPSNCCAFL